MSKQEELIQALAEKIIKKTELVVYAFENEEVVIMKNYITDQVRTLLSHLVPGEEELIGIMNRYQSRPLFEDAEVLDPMDFHKVAKDVINRLTGKE
jgi:hypothetical protein